MIPSRTEKVGNFALDGSHGSRQQSNGKLHHNILRYSPGAGTQRVLRAHISPSSCSLGGFPPIDCCLERMWWGLHVIHNR